MIYGLMAMEHSLEYIDNEVWRYNSDWNSKKGISTGTGWIDDVDIEEMDINWQIAMIAIRMKKFYKKTGRSSKGTLDGKKKRDSFYQHQEAGKQEKNQMGLLTMDDGIVNWGEHNNEKMAREAEVKRVVNTGNGVVKPVWTNANRINHANKLVPRSVQLNTGSIHLKNIVDRGIHKLQSAIASEEKDEDVELIVVPSAVKIPEEKDESRDHLPNIQR
ncbi:hypothetical protein Tco_1108759 [Tanacetum coccineum]